MTGPDRWSDFVQAHGQIIGYVFGGEVFMPADPRYADRYRHLVEGRGGVPVYGPVVEDRAET